MPLGHLGEALGLVMRQKEKGKLWPRALTVVSMGKNA